MQLQVLDTDFVAVPPMVCLEDRQLCYIFLPTVFYRNYKLIDSSGIESICTVATAALK